MSQKDNKKLKINPWKIIGIYAAAFLVFELIFYVTFQGINGTFFPPDNSFYYYTPILFIATAIFCVVSLTQTYYEIVGPVFTHYKMGKVVEYTFNNIVYIDEEFSVKKKMFRFFTKDGQEHLLIFDRKGVLYETALKKCPLISKEEFQRRFPNKKM